MSNRLDHDMGQIVRGDTFSIKLNVVDKNGDPVDLTGRSIYFTMKQSLNEPDQNAAVRYSEVISDPEATDGKAVIHILPQYTSTLNATKYWYDIQLVTNQQKVHTLKRGRIEVILDVTQTTDVVEVGGLIVEEEFTFTDFEVI